MRRSASLLCTVILCGLLLSGCKNDDVAAGASLPGIVTEPTQPTVAYKTEDTTVPEEVTLPEVESTKRTARTDDMPSLATTTPAPDTEPDDGSISVIPDIPNIPIGQYTSTSKTTRPVQSDSAASLSITTTTKRYDDDEPYEIEDDWDDDEIYEDGYDPRDKDPTLQEAIYRPYGYNSLDEKKKKVYDAIIDSVSRKSDYVDLYFIDGVTAEDYCDVYNLLYNDEEALFYMGTKMQYAINQSTNEVRSATLFYDYTKEEIKQMQALIDAEAGKILAKITPEMTHYDIVKLFYDELAENVVYDEDADNCSDIYGVFVGKRAICGGYSKAFSYLCDKVGIETLTITGDADEIPHMWNMVKLDGAWYHIDITYAVTESKLGSYVRYDYFCISDDVISRSRDVYDQFYKYPRASSRTYNYYVRNGLVANSYDEAYEMLYNGIIKASSEKSLVAEILCGSKEVYDETSYELFSPARKKALDLMEDALTQSVNKYKTDNISYASDDNTYVIKLFLEYTK